MKTKYLILFLSLFCCMGIKAIKKEISLRSCTDSKEIWVKEERSITLEPTATIDGNIIRIYSNVTIMNLEMSIKDSMGNIVYFYNDMTPSRCHTFDIDDLTEGEYILEIRIGEESYYGSFIN